MTQEDFEKANTLTKQIKQLESLISSSKDIDEHHKLTKVDFEFYGDNFRVPKEHLFGLDISTFRELISAIELLIEEKKQQFKNI